MREFDIEYPDEKTIEKQIETIVMTGLPIKISFYAHLKKMYKNIGLKYLFRDMTETVYVILLAAVVLTFIGFSAKDYFNMNDGNVYTFIFVSSPMMYLAICLISYLKLKQTHTYEVEMTCKYDVFQLAAFRMLAFSIICLGLNAGFIALMVASYQHVNFLTAFMISVTSLFLFSAVFLFVMMRTHSNVTKYFYAGGWVLVNFLLFAYSEEAYHLLIKHIPIYVYIVLTIACSGIYIKNLKKLITFRRTEGVA